MRLLDVQHPFFVPVWRRVAIVVLCLGWAIFEFVSGAPFWGVLFGAAGIYCGWQFFAVFDPKPERTAEEKAKE
jgi:hypothetical protein